MNTGFQLYQLQRVDSSIDIARKRIHEIDSLIENDKTVSSAKSAAEKAEKTFIKIKNEFDELNAEIQSRKNKKSQSESSLYSGTISNPKELQDLQKEITYLNSSISSMEDKLLQKLIDLENAETKWKKAKEDLKNILSAFETRKSLLLGEKNKLESDLKSQRDRRSSIISQIEKSDLERYESIRDNKNGIAVSKMVDGACSVCGASLTPSQQQQARSPGSLFSCPSCSRIVYGS